MKRTKELDPITVEVIRNYFLSTARQMKSVLIRASFNPVIYEMVDFSIGLYNRKAELLAEAPALPVFMGTLTFAIRNVVNYLGEDNLEDGDVILTTYPYWTGAHSQDATVIKPIFVGNEIFGYAAAKAHWMDIGAIDIYGVNTTDIWQEGLQLYAVKICKKGKIDNELVEILRANSRVPDGIVGDLNGQIACANTGAKKVVELVNKYGKETVEAAIKGFFDHGEEITRKAIAEMPDGEWTAEGALDDNGITDEPVKVKLTVKVKGDEMTWDTTGSAPQQVGPVNCPYPTTVSFARLVVKMLTTPLYPANEGCFRALKVVAPEGSMFNPKPPAPVFLYGWAGDVLGELAFKALAEAAPERVVARSGGDLCASLWSGIHPEDGIFFASGADECCGQGAGFDCDGENAVIMFSLGESHNVPVEVIEERYPVFVQKYELRQDSCGAGKFRGGLGVNKIYRTDIGLNLVWIVEQTKFPAWGLFGGKYGLPNIGIINPGTSKEKKVGKVVSYKLFKGDEWHIHSGGGGGWGNPFERDAKAVLKDVIGGYVSLDSARKDYGVAIRQVQGEYVLDEAETAKLRK
jgi:N-methylhydantoinase B